VEFSAFFLCTRPDGGPAERIYSETLEHVKIADELGYDATWFAEHHFSNYGYLPNPLLFAVKIAQQTPRIRVGTGVLVMPFWNPVRIAEDIAMTDQLTDGRLEIGVARGYQPYEYSRFGLHRDDARDQTDESLEVMLKALTERAFTHDGPAHQIPETTIYPRPLQQPRPPIWLASSSRESFDLGVRHGLKAITTTSTRPIEVIKASWQHYLDAREAAGVSGPTDFSVQQNVVVAPTDAEAREQMSHVLYNNRQAQALRSDTQRVEDGVSAELPYEGEPTLDQLFEERTFSGSPETVVRKLRAYTDICDIRRLNCVFRLGSMSPETVAQSIRLFAAEVMPHFK
jgi:alkanesulfonate monooxygenase SsuD/methylene tetrahydromethanopterin reductase-like flavin-dependent oxidoreductase (luciferase family)